jgi:hypothetical protein
MNTKNLFMGMILAVGLGSSWPLHVAASIGTNWIENDHGDAGGLSNPQIITEKVDFINGTIGDGNDIVDAFAFDWNLSEPTKLKYYSSQIGSPSLEIYIYKVPSLGGDILGNWLLSPDTTTDAIGLVQGDTYILKVATTNAVDPPFTIGAMNPTTGAQQVGAFAPATRSAVPEPTTLTLISLGLAGMAFGKRRNKVI